MLSVKAIKNSSQASHYFFEQDNYYMKDVEESKALTEWFGEGAKRLGLKGNIAKDQFQALLQGLLPNGEQLGKRVDNQRVHRPGLDLTFSAPKSVSLLCCTGIDVRLEGAHNRAVNAALSAIERACAQARVREDGVTVYENTHNLVIAKFPHDTSRDLDPQKHTHCVVLNMTERKDGKWRALASQSPDEKFKNGDEVNGFYERVVSRANYFGLLYRAQLAHEVTELGYQIQKTDLQHGFFEINLPGLTSEILGSFSKRREAIEIELEKRGLDGGKASQFATLVTRKPKQEMDRDELRIQWKKEAEALGLSLENLLIPKAGNIRQENPLMIDAARFAVREAIVHHSSFDVQLSHTQLFQTALQFSIGEAQPNEIAAALQEHVKNGFLLTIPEKRGEAYYTTQKLVDIEKQIFSGINAGKSQKVSLLSVKQQMGILVDERLSEPQAQALVQIFQSTDQMTTLVGATYQDKTCLLNPLIEYAEKNGLKVRVISPTSQQTQEIKNYAHRKTDTLWKWLVNFNRPELGETVAGFKQRYKEELSQPLSHLFHRNDFIIVDSSEKLGNSDIQAIMQLTEKSQARVLFMGDQKAKNSVMAGNPWQELILKTAHTIDLVSLNAKKSLEKQAKAVEVVLTAHADLAERKQALTQHYAKLSLSEQTQTIVMTSTKKQAHELNRLLRASLQAEGHIGQTQQTVMALSPHTMTEAEKKVANRYKPEQVIRFNENYLSLGVKKGDYATISSIIPRRNLVELILHNGKKIAWDPHRVYQGIEVFNREKMELAIGDRLNTTRRMRDLNLVKGTVLIVETLHKQVATVSDGKGKSYKLILNKDEQLHFNYNYAKPIGQISDKPQQNTFALVDANQANQRLLHELSKRTQNKLHIYTDDSARLTAQLNQSGNKLGAIHSLLQSEPAIIRHMQETTGNAVKHDIEIALDAVLTKLSIERGDTPQAIANKAVKFAMEKLTERDAGFKHTTLVEESLKYALGSVSLEEISQVIKEKRTTGELIMGRYFNDGTRWTTQEAINLEKSIIATAERGKNAVPSMLDAKVVVQQLANTTLTEGQKNACKLMTTTTDRLVLVQGYAGTGKTTMLQEMKALLEKQESPYKILGLAPTHRAVSELKAVGIEAQTLDSFLVEAQRLSRQNATVNHHNTLVILDEASMVSNHKFATLSEYLEKTGGRYVMLGDRRQLSSPESGKPFEIAQRAGVKTATMDNIVRQKTPELLAAVRDTIKGSHLAAFEKIENLNANEFIKRQENITASFNHSIIEIDDKKLKNLNTPTKSLTLMETLAQDYLTRVPEVREKTLIIAHANKDRVEINQLIREGLKEQSILDKSTATTFTTLVNRSLTQAELKNTLHYNSGNRVRFNRAISELGIEKDSYLTVTGIDPKLNLLTLTDQQGKTIAWQPDKSGALLKGGVEVYESQNREACVGDLIRLSRTDNTRKITSQTEGRIAAVAKDRMLIAGKDGRDYNLNPNEARDQHWDHAYSVTGYGAQGATKPYVLDYEVSFRVNLVHQRSFYVAISRASLHISIYTDNKKAFIERIQGNTGDKFSALEVLGALPHNLNPGNSSEGSKKKLREDPLKQPKIKLQDETIKNPSNPDKKLLNGSIPSNKIRMPINKTDSAVSQVAVTAKILPPISVTPINLDQTIKSISQTLQNSSGRTKFGSTINKQMDKEK